jgi:ketosteroid isomerase-like protein
MLEGNLEAARRGQRGVVEDQAVPLKTLVDRAYAAWNSQDLEAFLAVTHPEIELSTSGLFPDAVGPFHGHDGIRRFWRRFTEPWERLDVGYEELRELGPDTVLVRVRFHGLGREGIEVNRSFAHHYTIRDGLLYRQRSWAEWDEALTDLGLENERSGGG